MRMFAHRIIAAPPLSNQNHAIIIIWLWWWITMNIEILLNTFTDIENFANLKTFQ